MGGNARVIDLKSGKVIAHAEKIDLEIFSRSQVRKTVFSILSSLNEIYEYRYCTRIWKDFRVVKSRKVFSGSSLHFFDTKITDKEFISYKSKIGDIDVMIPRHTKERFEEMMKSLENWTISPYSGHTVTYLGQDRTDFGTTFLAVFKYQIPKKGLSVNFQIDFEYSDYEKDEPTEWAQFSHSAAWCDMVTGLKGVHHKFLLINLVRAMSMRKDVVIATPASTSDKIRIVTGKKASQTPRMLAFSVDRGLRLKYLPLKDINGKSVIFEGKTVFREVETDVSLYITELESIFFYIFGRAPMKKETVLFKSFWGLIHLVRENLTNSQIESLFDYMLNENLYGKYAQVIEKNNAELDMGTKQRAVDTLFSTFSFLKKKKKHVEDLRKEYYEVHYKRHLKNA
jgi:hypothetical protein